MVSVWQIVTFLTPGDNTVTLCIDIYVVYNKQMTLAAIKESQSSKAIILGSGVTVLEGKEPIASIPYADIPGWPLGKVKGHKGVLDIYDDIWVLRGRAHLYEGFSWQQACFPTQFLVDNGIKELIVTNSAGGINPDYQVGDLMQITGYLDFIRPGKERGNLEALTQKIIPVSTSEILFEKLSDARLAKIGQAELTEPSMMTAESECNAADGTLRMRSGVYVAVHGPNYESDAEVALFRKLGADAVGMSTAPELEVAITNSLKITAISVITNVYGKTEDLGHEGVLAAAKQASEKLTKLLRIN